MVDVVGQYRKIQAEVDQAIRQVLDSGQFILGPAVAEFENAAAAYLNVKHACRWRSWPLAWEPAMK